MNIEDVKTAFKVADVVLDKEHEKNYIKFVFLSELFDEKGKKLDKSILRDKRGRVYIITVDGVIKKIGGSIDKGGIKATLSFYQAAMQGRPSLRSYGTHLLIKEALEKGSSVEIYMITSTGIEAPIKGLFSEKAAIKMVAVFKEMEDRCKEDYNQIEGTYPEWNFQERGVPWPAYLQESHNKYLATTIGGRGS